MEANGEEYGMGPGTGHGMGRDGKRRCPMLDMTPEERILFLEESLAKLPSDSPRYHRHARILEELRGEEEI